MFEDRAGDMVARSAVPIAGAAGLQASPTRLAPPEIAKRGAPNASRSDYRRVVKGVGLTPRAS